MLQKHRSYGPFYQAIFLKRNCLEKIPYFEGFAKKVVFSFTCISWAIEVQITYPGTLLETRDQGLSFGTKIYGILFIIGEDISS